MEERAAVTKFKGYPVTLVGPTLEVGDKAPDFKVVDADLNQVTLNKYLMERI